MDEVGNMQVARESMRSVCKVLEDIHGDVACERFEDWQGGAADAARDDLLVLLGQLGVVMDSGDDALLALDTAIAECQLASVVLMPGQTPNPLSLGAYTPASFASHTFSESSGVF